MARNKVAEKYRAGQTLRRDIEHEVPLDVQVADNEHLLVANIPTVSEVAMAKEHLVRLMEGQPAHYRRIVAMRADSFSYREIAQVLEMHEGSVRRAMRRIIRDLSR